MLASTRVDSSMPVVLRRKLMMVTNITASTSPASAGACVHEKLCKVSGRHGEIRLAVDCGRNIQPLACASPSDQPASSKTM